MADRRRFFPSKPVQQLPGRTVELEMQLRPAGVVPVVDAAPAPPPAPGGCDLFGAGWVLGSRYEDMNEWLGGETLPDGRLRIWDGWGEDTYTIWEGEPPHHTAFGDPRPIAGPGFRCVEIGAQVDDWAMGTVFHAVIEGRSMVDAHWQWQWSGRAEGDPMSELGHTVETWGNVLQVLVSTDVGATWSHTDVLTARAFCSGNQVAELTLRLLWLW